MSDVRQLGERIEIMPADQRMYEAMATNIDQRAVYMVRGENYAALANYTCDFVEAIPDIGQVVTAAFWFRRSNRELSSEFHKRSVLEINGNWKYNRLDVLCCLDH